MGIYLSLCLILEFFWWNDLGHRFSYITATLIVIGLAILPGIMISMNLIGCILDKPRRRPIFKDQLNNITILIAAYNEESSIYDTIKSISEQTSFPKKIYVKVIDNNSTDNTKKEIYRAIKDFPSLSIEYIFEEKQGKFAALNAGLAKTNTANVITLDADTFLYKDALLNISNAFRFESSNKKVGAIAGTVFVKNSKKNLITKMQAWEYLLTLTCIKRVQGLFQSTLVAQGAFSIFDTALLKQLGGWKDSVGEDIVLSWEILSAGYNIYYEDQAICYTNAPTTLKVFTRQRARWAAGMIEGFKHFKFKKCNNKYSRFFVFLDLFLILIDLSIVAFWIPGIILALFQDYIIVGLLTLLLYPLTLIAFIVMFQKEYRYVLKPLEIKTEKTFLSFFIFTFVYSIILAPACIKGYISETFNKKCKWK